MNDERPFHFSNDTRVEAGCGQGISMRGKIIRNMAIDTIG
jgi:hypothetical protein